MFDCFINYDLENGKNVFIYFLFIIDLFISFYQLNSGFSSSNRLTRAFSTPFRGLWGGGGWAGNLLSAHGLSCSGTTATVNLYAHFSVILHRFGVHRESRNSVAVLEFRISPGIIRVGCGVSVA